MKVRQYRLHLEIRRPHFDLVSLFVCLVVGHCVESTSGHVRDWYCVRCGAGVRSVQRVM